MDQMDYYRLHVELHTVRDISNWNNEKVFAAFLLLPNPHLDVETWSGVIGTLSKPQVPTQAEQDAANAAAAQTIQAKIST